nr:hypothetical protein [Tanacetum cinerariifolium]
MSDMKMGLDVFDTLCFQLGEARRRMTWRQFILALGLHTVKEMAEDGFEAKSGARLSGGHVIGRLAAHFGLVSNEGLRGLSMITRETPMIDLRELVRLNIYERHYSHQIAPPGLCLRGSRGSRKRCTSYGGALWDYVEISTDRSLIRVVLSIRHIHVHDMAYSAD